MLSEFCEISMQQMPGCEDCSLAFFFEAVAVVDEQVESSGRRGKGVLREITHPGLKLCWYEFS